MTGDQRYREAGVDIAAADAGLARIIAAIKGTWPAAGQLGGVALDIGYFANVIDIGGGMGWRSAPMGSARNRSSPTC